MKVKYKVVNIYRSSDKKDRRKAVTQAVQRCIDMKAGTK